LLDARDKYPVVKKMLKSDKSNIEKRDWIVDNIKGIGMKEASHFMRNIGYRDLAILDRHILKHLVEYLVLEEIPQISSIKKYLEIEKLFMNFSKKINISIDELDLFFWSSETGEILK
jgi:N-glycosylase/DNA lyase